MRKPGTYFTELDQAAEKVLNEGSLFSDSTINILLRNTGIFLDPLSVWRIHSLYLLEKGLLFLLQVSYLERTLEIVFRDIHFLETLFTE